MIHIADAISSLCPNISFKVHSSYDSIEFINPPDSFIQPSEEEVQLKIDELTAAEPMRQLRMERTRILAESDWMANSDVTMTEEWRVYRQALRDITTQTPSLDENGQLTGINWPTQPEA